MLIPRQCLNGHILNIDDKFCGRCGAIPSSARPESPQAISEQHSGSTFIDPVGEASSAAPPSPERPRHSGGAKGSRRIKFRILGSLVVLIVVVVVLVLAISSSSNSGSTAVQNYIDSNGNTWGLQVACTFTGAFDSGNKVYSCTYSGGGDTPQFANGTGDQAWGSCFDVGPSGADPNDLGC